MMVMCGQERYEDGKLCAGGGAPEAELAKGLRSYAVKVGGREQLAIEAFAEAVEAIPLTLAETRIRPY